MPANKEKGRSKLMAMNYEIRGGSGNSLFFCTQNVIQQERMSLAYNEVNMNAMNQAPQEITLWNLSRDDNSLLWCNSHSFTGEYGRGGCAGTLNYYHGVGNQRIPLQPNCIPNSFHCQNKIVSRNFNIGSISGTPNAMSSGGLSNMTMHHENRQVRYVEAISSANNQLDMNIEVVSRNFNSVQPNCIPNSFHCQNKILSKNFNIGCTSGTPNAMYSGGLSNMTMHPENRQVSYVEAISSANNQLNMNIEVVSQNFNSGSFSGTPNVMHSVLSNMTTDQDNGQVSYVEAVCSDNNQLNMNLISEVLRNGVLCRTNDNNYLERFIGECAAARSSQRSHNYGCDSMRFYPAYNARANVDSASTPRTIADVYQACANSPKSSAAWRPSIPMAYMMSRWTPEAFLRAARAASPQFCRWADEDMLSQANSIAKLERRPLTEKMLTSRLYTRVFDSSARVTGLESSTGDNLCGICMAEYEDEDKIAFLYYCPHEFHADCVKKWLLQQNTCPLCREIAFIPRDLPECKYGAEWHRAFISRVFPLIMHKVSKTRGSDI